MPEVAGGGAGRAGSSAPLRSACVMEKTLWGRAGKYQLTLPQHSKAGPGRQWMGEREHGMGRWWGALPELSAAPDQLQGGAELGSAQRPHGRGLWGSEPLLRDAPQKASALAIIRISGLCSSVEKAEAVEGKCSNLARKNFLRWRLRPHCCDLWGLAQPRLHPHTSTRLIPSFPSPSTP